MVFKGFRGFGKDSEFIDLKDLTILTGKNSSGKSTFLKLIKLFGDALSEVETLYNVLNLKIQIDNELIGGKQNLTSIEKVTEVKWVFSVPIEFYFDYHEIHLSLKINEYLISIEKIEIFDLISLKSKKPFISVDSKLTILNIKYLFSKYRFSASFINAIEQIRNNYSIEVLSDNEILNSIKHEYSLYGFTNEDILYFVKTNPYPIDFDENTIIGENNLKLVDEKFMELDINSNDFLYKIEYQENSDAIKFYLPPEKFLKISKNGINSLINGSVWRETILSFIDESESIDSLSHFEKLLIDWYDYELEYYVINTKDFSFEGMAYHHSEQAIEIQSKKQIIPWFKSGQTNSSNELIGYTDFRYELMSINQDKISHFVKISFDIYQKYIMDFFHKINHIKYLSNIRNIPERSYNIFNSQSLFSKFIKYWRTISDIEQNFKLDFLRYYLQLFEIADDVKIKIEDNVGFIKLKKKGHLISVIDEGSGVSNLLSLLLFLALNISKNMEDDYSFQKKIELLVLEEPESNLHPSMQSKIADLLVDVILNWNVNFIIETHSEYLIRKLQYLVAKEVMQPDSISLNYFSLDYKANAPFISHVKIPISKDGRLEAEFGSGFFDEADNIAIQLFNLQKSRLN